MYVYLSVYISIYLSLTICSSDAQNILILMTDGFSNMDRDRTIPELKLLKKEGVSVITVRMNMTVIIDTYSCYQWSKIKIISFLKCTNWETRHTQWWCFNESKDQYDRQTDRQADRQTVGRLTAKQAYYLTVSYWHVHTL